ncbi:cholesterol 7-desaturase nvd [Anabrus simplex]|uniref:cholesterol 7-desaturase nvd n=1 Tax=Anabrus simplex TaxID=316456 RepID=UPI0034DD1CBE
MMEWWVIVEALIQLPPIIWLCSLGPMGWLKLLISLLIVSLSYYYLVLPLNWKRDLSDVSYSHEARGKSKCQAVRDVRRRRKLGNLPPVYPNGWFMLLEADLLAPGQVRHVAALGENFAVFRTQEGEVHVLDAYCPHLGANMGVGGAVRGDCLECPFHGWRFRGSDGKCTAVPYSEKVPEFAKVKRWESCEVNTVIFVWYHAEDEPPSWRPQDVPNVKNGVWHYRGRSEFMINSHIQEIPENGGDLAHLNAIHGPSVLAGSDLHSVERLITSFARHVWSATWAPHEEPDMAHAATMRLQHEVRLFNKLSLVSMNVRAEQIGPGYVEMYLDTSLGPLFIVQCVTPIEPLLQRVVHRIFCPPLLSIYATFVLVGEAIMFERDIMVWNHKKYEDKPLLVREDRAIQRHRRWYSQFYSDNSPRFSFLRENMEW